MQEVKIDFEELKAAIVELEARGKTGQKINIKIENRRLYMSCTDKKENTIEAIMYSDGNLGAEFKMTERLMYMKGRRI